MSELLRALPRTFPLPVRVAAGLAATAVEQARRLPTQLAELPVTTVSTALTTSMRLQQQITELAIKGDEVLEAWRPEDDFPESAPWAEFDEDMAREAHSSQEDTAPPQDTVPPQDAAPPLPGYDELSVAQLRGKLRSLSLEQLIDLLEYEQAGPNRPPFVTMLSNRIQTLRSQ